MNAEVVSLIDWIAVNIAFVVLMFSLVCLTVFAAMRKPVRTVVSFLAVVWSIWEVTH